jgi:OmpR-family two-component system manganese-sensing sensor histidine kinase
LGLRRSEEIEETLQRLDWELGGGVVVALVLSGLGGIWLTRQAMQPIEKSFQRLQPFTSDASHELRSPLMAIKSNAAVALKYSAGIRETDREKFEVIANATGQMTRLAEDLLLLARSDRVTALPRSSVNVNVILDKLIQQYQSKAQAREINLSIDLNSSLSVTGNSEQLTRLFSNLIENALQYTLSQGVVDIKANRAGSSLSVTIQDTGVGIAPEHLEKVFERFWRAEQSRSYWEGGSGLGLAIARAIAQNHGGSITVKSQLGIGSCFTVCLPASISD